MGQSFRRVGVIGLGIMGAGIVEVFARSGREVVGVAESSDAVGAGVSNLFKSLERAVDKGKLTEDESEKILGRVTLTTDYETLSKCELVVEAAPEIMSLKETIFSKLDEVTLPGTVLATNTSSLSVKAIGKSTSRPELVIGMHFFNPAPVQTFVEIIKTSQSDPKIVEAVADLARDLGKYPAIIKDQPGFIVNRLLLVYLNHAAQIFERDPFKRDAIDSGIRELAGFPMGPLELIDLIGVDTCVAILETIAAHTGNDAHQPAGVLVRMLADRQLGRKSGTGFYTYESRHEAPVSDDGATKQAVHDELITAYVADSQAMLDSGYASREDINMGMKLGCGLPRGPLEETV